MKASDYVSGFKTKGSTVHALCDVANAMMDEVIAIQKARNARSNEAIFSILNEISLKWKSFVRQAGLLDDGTAIRPDGFDNVVKLKLPGVYVYWKNAA